LTPAVIIGGGISGLSTAYYLTKSGVPSILIEERPRLGGVIQTDQVEGCTIEAGPDSFLSIKPAAMELIRDLGMADEVIGSNDEVRKTYVWKNRRLIALPDGLMFMVPTQILPMAATSLLSWPTKIRMGLEWFHRARNQAADQSVAEFVESHYGREAVDYLAEPLLSGIYGGDPEVLSIRSVLPRFVELEQKYGSLTRGVLAERKASPGRNLPLFQTLRSGLASLTRALAARIHSRVIHGTAEAVERSGGEYRVRVNGNWIASANLLLACEAHRAAPLAAGVEPRAGELLAAIPYSSSMTVALAFDEREFRPEKEGFGFLVPRRERRRLIACTYIGTKFTGRVPPGTIVLRCFLGGAADARVLEETDASIVAAMLEELREIVNLRAQPKFARISRWPRSMAQYTVGHQVRTAELFSRLPEGLHLAGNAYTGIGIPDCIRMGNEAAARISSGIVSGECR
jgi:oxygen-dependent protoporphyrinogen oxidase